MSMKDPVEWAKSVADIVKNYLSSAAETLVRRLDQIENKLKEIPAGPKGDPGPEGKPGINAYEVAVSLGFQGSVHDWMATFRGMKGDPGESIKGDKGDPGESIKGEMGDPGLSIKGDKGDPGADADMQALRDEAARNIQKIFADFLMDTPLPKDGKDGADGKSVTVEDMRSLFESEQAKWALDFERRAQDVLRGMGDKIPIPKDGKDGLGFDDLEIVHDGERNFKFVFKQGERVKEFQFNLPIVIERGVYRPDTQYKTGDGVTYGGSYWIALADTTQKPGEGKDFRLSVKKGRDGRDGERGERGPEGPKGKDK